MHIPKEIQLAWSHRIAAWLVIADRTVESVKTGSEAWSILSATGLLREAYQDPKVLDAHIQTVLERIFPNAVFRDKKRY